jgi:hypothetical protein
VERAYKFSYLVRKFFCRLYARVLLVGNYSYKWKSSIYFFLKNFQWINYTSYLLLACPDSHYAGISAIQKTILKSQNVKYFYSHSNDTDLLNSVPTGSIHRLRGRNQLLLQFSSSSSHKPAHIHIYATTHRKIKFYSI